MKLFAYGTLQDPTIQQQLFGKIVTGTDAELSGYSLKEVKIDGQAYAGIYPKEDGSVLGTLIEITEEEIKKCDEYEGASYQRIYNPDLQAWMYVATDSK